MSNVVFKFPIADMAVKPSAIFISKLPRSMKWWSVSLGFASHTHYFNIIGTKNNLFFEHCEPCVYYRDKTCPGGERVLLNSRINNTYSRTAYDSDVTVYNGTFCRKLFDNPDKRTNLKEGVKGVPTTLPDYFLTSGYEYQDYTDNTKLIFSYLRQDLVDPTDESTYWKASPPPFPNTYESSGSICTGRNRFNDLCNFGDLQSVFLNQVYNYDLFYTSHYGFNDLESCLRAMNFDKFLEITIKKCRDAHNINVLFPFNSNNPTVVRKILPPIYEKLWIDSESRTVKLVHSDGTNYTLPLDLSGEPVQEVS